MRSDEKRYPVKIRGTPEELRHLAHCRLAPEGRTIFLMTEREYQGMPGAGDLRDHLAFQRGIGDGLSFIMGRADVVRMMGDLLEVYNDENPGSPYDERRKPGTLTIRETTALIAAARCASMGMKVRPEDNGITLTQAMREQGLSPDAVFVWSEDRTRPGKTKTRMFEMYVDLAASVLGEPRSTPEEVIDQMLEDRWGCNLAAFIEIADALLDRTMPFPSALVEGEMVQAFVRPTDDGLAMEAYVRQIIQAPGG